MTTSKHFRSAAYLLTLAALLLTPAYALDVTYSTTGTFTTCAAGFSGCGTTVLSGPGGLKITFLPTPSGTVTVPPATNAEFGTFVTSGQAPGGAFVNLAGNAFTLKVIQSGPFAATETLLDTISGSIKLGSSSAKILFTSGSGDGGVAVTDPSDPAFDAPSLKFSFGGVEYWVDKNTPIHMEKCDPNNQPCTAANAIQGQSIINGAIDTVPEPTFYALTGTGFAGLFFMAIRRRRQKV